jgi:hypothetical protein
LPVEVSERELLDAVARMGEWDRDCAAAARAALEWLGWEGQGPLLVRRYEVQLFAWYTLPRKFLATLQDKREAAEAFARTLERIGGGAASYGEVCRRADTDALLCAWENDDPAARGRLRELLEESGIEPPDTELLAWGQVMGLEEARAHDQVAVALEEAIEDGRLSPGSRGFRRAQAEVADAALHEPWDGNDGRTRLEVIHAECMEMERRIRRGNTRGSDQRRALIDPIVALLQAPTQALDPDACRDALAPALLLLERASDGLALTQTGALNRALVREVAERWPGWWNAELFGPPNREDGLAWLCELDELLRGLRLVRRSARRLLITARGRALSHDPPALLMTFVRELLLGDSFRAACAELVSALLLTGVPASFSQAFAARVHLAIVAEGWQADGEPPDVLAVHHTVADFVRPAEAIGLLARAESTSPRQPDLLSLTQAGRAALIAGLRERAHAPATGPY